MNSYSIENKLQRLAEIRKATSDYECALSKYLNFQKLNTSEKISIVIESKLSITLDYIYLEKYLSDEIDTTFSNLKKLEVI